MIAADLVAWLKMLALDGDLAKAEPKALRYRLLHVPARLVHGGRRRRLRLPKTWPWVEQLVAAFARIAAIHHLPDPTSPSLPEETWRTAHRQRQPANKHAFTWPRVQVGPRQPGWQLSSRLMKDGG